MNNPLKYSLEYWLQAYWYKRFSEEPKNPLVVKACSQVTKFCPEECLVNILNVTHEPVFDKQNSLIGKWVDNGSVFRPKNKRFFERAGNDNKYHVWIYEDV